VLLLIEGLSLCDFQAHESLFPAVTDIFANRVEVITPLAYNGSLVEEVAAVPLTGTQKHKLLNGELHYFRVLCLNDHASLNSKWRRDQLDATSGDLLIFNISSGNILVTVNTSRDPTRRNQHSYNQNITPQAATRSPICSPNDGRKGGRNMLRKY
jgi:hypothetical protein